MCECIRLWFLTPCNMSGLMFRDWRVVAFLRVGLKRVNAVGNLYLRILQDNNSAL